MKEKSYEYECQLDLGKRPVGSKPKAHTHSKSKLPPIVRMLVLAHQIERALAEGRATSLTDVASKLGVSQPRVTQIMKLCDLPTELKEKILMGNSESLRGLSEPKLRKCAARQMRN